MDKSHPHCRDFAALGLVVLVLCGVVGCGRVSATPQAGFIKETHVDSEGEVSHYVVFVPPSIRSDEKRPVILFLNGWGENGEDGLRQISNNFGGDVWRMRGYFPFLAVCPQCSYHGSWAPGTKNADRALEILNEAIQKYGGDPDRVTVTGASSGGAGALALASAEPDRFAAVVPVAAGSGGQPSTLAASGMPIWSFHNRRDAKDLVESARRHRETLLVHGLSPVFTEFDAAGHNAWDPAYGSPLLYGWLLKQNRRQRVDWSRFQLQGEQELQNQWTAAPMNLWSVQGFEICTQEVPQSKGLLSSSYQRGEVDFHLDVFLSEQGGAQLQIANDDQAWVAKFSLETQGGEAAVTSNENVETPLDPVSAQSLHLGWNDVRMSRREGRFQIQINGWPALNIADPFQAEPLQWRLMAGADLSNQWRYLRLRTTLKHSQTESAE